MCCGLYNHFLLPFTVKETVGCFLTDTEYITGRRRSHCVGALGFWRYLIRISPRLKDVFVGFISLSMHMPRQYIKTDHDLSSVTSSHFIGCHVALAIIMDN
jgi:hypothetical protein